METRTLGRSGLRLSLVGLGCNNFGGRLDLAATRAVVNKALDLGITHFDTADIYGGGGRSEELLGEALGARRKDIVLATKFGKPMGADAPSRRGAAGYVTAAVEASLKRLRTDWIDLLYMHEPDPATPVEETLRTLEDLVAAGKLRHLAASNFSAAEIGEAAAAAERLGAAGFAAAQEEYSLLARGIEDAVLPALETAGLGLVPYFPLASGALTGKYRKGEPMPEGARLTGSQASAGRFFSPANQDKVEALRTFAEARGRTLLELAMSWLAGRPLVASIIAGATRPEQVEANAAAAGWRLSADEAAEVDRITL